MEFVCKNVHSEIVTALHSISIIKKIIKVYKINFSGRISG